MFIAASGIVHGDLACRNVLVSTEQSSQHSARRRFTLKLADFGLSTHATDEQYVEIDIEAGNESRTGARVATAWAAPEVLTRRDFSTKSDVYELIFLYIIICVG